MTGGLNPNSSQDIFCRHCGYNLRGLTKNRCPECGEEFVPDALPRRQSTIPNGTLLFFFISPTAAMWLLQAVAFIGGEFIIESTIVGAIAASVFLVSYCFALIAGAIFPFIVGTEIALRIRQRLERQRDLSRPAGIALGLAGYVSGMAILCMHLFSSILAAEVLDRLSH